MYQKNIDLQPYNSFKTKAFAKIFAQPETIDDIKKCVTDFNNESKLIVGGGCNLFFTKNFDGLVLHPQLFGIKELKETPTNQTLVEAMASENWDQFVQYCVDRNYAGLENLSFIPGTVGASPVQNIGAYGVEVKDTIHSVKTLDLKTKEIKIFTNKDCLFSYRDSIFKQTDQYIILSVTFVLHKTYSYVPKYYDLNKALEQIPSPTISDVRSAVIRVRQNKLPDEKILPNAGSFFKNPIIQKRLAEKLRSAYPEIPLYETLDPNLVKTSAAFLIDKTGMKGERIGLIGTYAKHALIIVNYGSSNGNDIISFMHTIQEKVLTQFEIKLEPEVRIL